MHHPPISLTHPTGNPNSREAALALAEAGLLHEIITTFAYDPQSSFASFLDLLPKSFRQPLSQELSRRTWLTPSGVTMRTYPWKELIRLLLIRSGVGDRLGLSRQRLFEWVYISLDKYIAKHFSARTKAVYAYEDGAATTFKAAKSQGILCLYDLPIPFYSLIQKLHSEEAELFPSLKPALTASNEPDWKIQRKQQEVELADHIFVASSVTQTSLLKSGIEPAKISVIPYGAPLEYFQPQTKPDQLFRAIFVGGIAPHKGVHYLLEAWKQLKLPNSELLIVGTNFFPPGWLAPYSDIFRYIPSVPHFSLNQYYSSANVLVFPSLAEGFGLVTLEAMTCGIPVITTSNVGSSDIISDGVEGFITPIRDVEALKEKLEWCYRHPQELLEMGQAARGKAKQLTWNLYHQQLAKKVQEILSK